MNEPAPAGPSSVKPDPEQRDHWMRLIRQHIAHLPGSRAQPVRGRVTYFVTGRSFLAAEAVDEGLELVLWLPPFHVAELLASGQGRVSVLDPTAVVVRVGRSRELQQGLKWIELAHDYRRLR